MAIKPGQLIQYKNGNIVKAEELPHGSSKKIICTCDICGKEKVKMVWQYYEVLNHNDGHYYCHECINHDNELLQSRNTKYIQTCLEKYGETSPMKLESVKEKLKKTNLEKYGTENPVVLYNNSACHTPEARQKAMKTMRDKYGGCGFEIEANRQKGLESLANSGKVPISSQQLEVYNLLKVLFPAAKISEPNFPLSTLSLDNTLEVDGIKIDIESDGKYWHQNPQKDRARDEIVKQFGYKILRIKFDHKVPTKEELKEALDKLISTDHTYYELILSDYE